MGHCDITVWASAESYYGYESGRHMRRIDNRQYKLTQIRQKRASAKAGAKSKKGRRSDSKLDRRGIK